jgi:LysM repeat protein
VLRGLLAAVILLALVVGVPPLLVSTVGNPVPDHWTWSAPLTNAALLGILACVAWVFWTQLLVCVVIETLAEIRLATGRSADWISRAPGTSGGQQALARTLVQAVVAMGVTTTAATAPTPWIAHADAATESTPPVASPVAVPGAAAAPVPQGPSAVEVEVVRGDTLWSIADGHLGAGERWREIAELNRGRQMADGSTFDDARTILPGWTLLVPSVARTNVDHHVVTVERGDTLWEIAQEEYGDGATWPRIYTANKDRIDDPHWIYPGQRFLVPGEPDVAPPDRPRVAQPNPPVQHRRPIDESPAPIEATPQVTESPPVLEHVGSGHRQAAVDDGGLHVDGATITRALLGGGGFFAAGMLAVYVARRRTQSRNRRSGRAALPVSAPLRAEAKALHGVGSDASRRAGFFDAALRELAAMAEKSAFDLPDAVAASVDGARLELHLRVPSPSAPAPWIASSDARTWSVSLEHQPTPTQRTSPYPAMVTLGVDDEGATWFIDLEAAGVVQIVGDSSVGEDLARYLAAQLAVNPWCDVETVDILRDLQDVVPLNRGRLFASSRLDIEQFAKIARQMVENVETSGRSVLASRVIDWENAWVPTVGIASLPEPELDTARPATASLLDEMERAPGRTSVVFVAASSAPLDQRAMTLTLTSDGNLHTPWAVVRPNRMTAAEATVLGKLFDDADIEGDVDMPIGVDSEGGSTNVDRAGALVEGLTEERCGTGDPDSILPRPDRAYIDAAATTVEDLAVLAPAVPPSEGAAAVTADPTLDQDLADWEDRDGRRPKLRVLGPVELRAVGEKTKEVEDRPAYFTELAAYLACHSEGVTPNQMAADFGIQNNTLHTRLGQLRKWMAKNPESDEWYLPIAQRIHGRQVYQLSGMLADVDLFRRLRARGEARGPHGIGDFRKALELVTGQPYDQQRSKGYGWLVDSPVDHYATAAIVDVAHVYATHSLAEGRPRDALWAAEKAIVAAPSEDKPRLDLARAMKAVGNDREVDRYLRDQVFNRSDDDRAPLEPSDRTVEVVDRMDPYNGR